jgi:glucose dehydrogenase
MEKASGVLVIAAEENRTERSRPEFWRGVDRARMLLVVGQIALLVFLFRHYEFESPAAGRVMMLALVGFLLQLASK